MASQTRSAGTGANDNSAGVKAWNNTGNIVSNNGSDADVSPTSTGEVNSQYLKATNFGFSIPAASTINGVTVGVNKYAADDSTLQVIDNGVFLVKGGTISGTDKKDTINVWSMSSTTISVYGGSADLWGLSLTDVDVNDASFGFVISGAVGWHVIYGGNTAYVDHIEITIDYTPPVIPSTLTGISTLSNISSITF